MEHTKLGYTEIEVSKLCVGCMSFGKAGTMHDWTLDQQQSEEMIRHAWIWASIFLIPPMDILPEPVAEALKLGTKVLVMDRGSLQQYDTLDKILGQPATDFVKRLAEKERRICHLPEEQLKDCEYSGAAVN